MIDTVLGRPRCKPIHVLADGPAVSFAGTASRTLFDRVRLVWGWNVGTERGNGPADSLRTILYVGAMSRTSY